jgi:hypothetical protein
VKELSDLKLAVPPTHEWLAEHVSAPFRYAWQHTATPFRQKGFVQVPGLDLWNNTNFKEPPCSSPTTT